LDWVITSAADTTCETESRSDIPRTLPDSSPAEIGDSITISGSGDRFKITVLGVIDPAVITSRGIKGTLAMLRDEEEEEPHNVRHIAVKLRMRNLEDASTMGVVHGICGGVLYDSEGREYASTGDSTRNCSALWAPKRGEQQPKVMCDAFRIPQGARPSRYVLAIGSWSRAQAGEWRLERSRAVESEPEFGVDEQLKLLESGVEAWNAWRKKHPKVEVQLASAKLQNRDLKGIDLSHANLESANLAESDLRNADFTGAHARSAVFAKATLRGANFSGCDLRKASFFEAAAGGAHFDNAVLTNAVLEKFLAHAAMFRKANLSEVRGVEANLVDCDFTGAVVTDADFTGALFGGAILSGLEFRGTKLTGAWLAGADLRSVVIKNVFAYGANLQGADLTGATITDSDLSLVTLVNAKLEEAIIVNTRVFGVSAWNIEGQLKRQDEIVITPSGQPRVTVNDLEVANFVYLILNNQKIRNAIETVGNKGVLILGRFTERKHVLEAIKKEISRLDLLPIVFDFERPADRDLTETIMTLAGLSRFIVADITAPKSVPLESHATVPNYMVPFVPLIQDGEKPFAMFNDLWIKHREWVLDPVGYASVDQLIRVFKKAVVDRANARLELLRARKAERLTVLPASDFEDPPRG
jgi:uncharacterized protein YjbI with pentapeptide repeats